jgi:regulator of protease activity HflC (stomatin/prohibitin superfamily)
MNAIDPIRPFTRATDSPEPAGSFASAGRGAGFVSGLTIAVASGCLLLAALWLAALGWPDRPLLSTLRHGRLLPVMLESLLLALTGCAGVWMMNRAWRLAVAEPRPKRIGWRRMLPAATRDDPAAIGRSARWPQAVIVTALSLLAAACAGLPTEPASGGSILPGAAALVLVFPLLVAERTLAAMPDTRLPQAAALRTLFLLPVLAWPLAGLAQIAAALGAPFAERAETWLLLPLTAIAAELALRALGRCFLPPPPPDQARAAIESLLARILADGLRARGLTAPIRAHLGIDFSRSWALAYLRAATPPVVLLLALVCWGLTGVILIGTDQRAVYERFGSVAGVLHPGLHLILPWPMGRVRTLELGVVHETSLADSNTTQAPMRVGAEDAPPPDADRLWEQAHPGELVFLIASGDARRQTFQVVSADIKLRYRLGLTDQAALLAAYSVADPEALLRGAAGRVVAGFFAGQTLDAVLGENRDEIASRLRAAIQRDLDGAASGAELVSVVIEAIHPPAGAAEAYHNVQAAQILADTSIAAERGRAIAAQAKASQYATEIVAQASAAAAETTGIAQADLTRFTADHAADQAASEAFRLDRRLTAIGTGLAKSALTIIDHRIPATDAPVLDLRPLSPGTARAAGPDQE